MKRGSYTVPTRDGERAQVKLTNKIVAGAKAPAAGYVLIRDTEVRGFALRVTKNGAKAFVFEYRAGGRNHRFTIGPYPAWKVELARDEAEEHRRTVNKGGDPAANRQALREAPTVGDLCARYEEDHLPRKRASSRRHDEAMITRHIRPELGKLRVADVTHSDIDRLHRKVTKGGAPMVANRVAALLSKMFNLACRWGWRDDNPVRGVERNAETPRGRYLTKEEVARLWDALNAHPHQKMANAVRLLLLTGARRSEVLGATWDQFATEGVWIKPSAHTKQKREHRVPLSSVAVQLLAAMKAEAEKKASRAEAKARASPANGKPAPAGPQYLFPSHSKAGHVTEIKATWRELKKAANLPADVRVHDLRHTYASLLAGSGQNLLIIGSMLGHTQAATTHRYSHLMDDPLRKAADFVGSIVAPAKPDSATPPSAENH